MQAAQAAHAAFEFSLHHPDLMATWHADSGYLILLAVPDEPALLEWADRVTGAGIGHALMREPDLDGQATALAVAPSPVGSLFSSLPLLGREVAVT